MTVPATTRRAGPFNGNGVTTSFPFTFKVFGPDDIAVKRADTSGVETLLVRSSDYTVTLNSNQDTSPGGSVVMLSPPAYLETLVIVGASQPDQGTDLPTGGAYRAQVVENALDKLTILIQQLKEELGRALTLPATSAGSTTELPTPVADNVIGWDSTGGGLRNFDPSTFASVVAYSNRRVLIGDGGEAYYTLAVDPGSINNTLVAVDGVVQTPGVDYTLSGLVLTPTAPFPDGAGNVTILYGQALPVGTTSADLVDYAAPAAGAVNRSAEDEFDELPLSVERFRQPGFTDQQTLEAWKTAVNARQITGDAAGFAGAPDALIPDRTYTLSADFTMPNGRILCRGKIVTGAFKVIFLTPRRTYCQGLTADTVLISGAYFSTWVDLKATTVTIDGYQTGFGSFWNTIKDSLCDIVIDLSKWSVNQNLFENGRGRIQTIGTTGSLLDGHMNNTLNWDFTSTVGGYTNTSTVQQNSTIINGYVEGVGPDGPATANISGPVNVLGLQGDVLTVPAIGRRNHLLFLGDVSERCHADFFPVSAANLVVGGEWDQLDTDGSGNIKPVGFFANPSFQASTITDATEPFGMGRGYGGTFTQEFSVFSLTLPAMPGGKFGLVLAYKGDDFSSVYVDRGGGSETYYGVTGVAIPGSAWKLYRMAGNANTGATTTIRFFITSGPGAQPAKTVHIGGCIVTPEKVVPLPSARAVRKLSTGTVEVQGRYIESGSVTKAATAAVSNIVEVAITFADAFSAAPRVVYSIENTDATNGPKMAKHWIKSGSLTASGCTVQIFTTGATDTWQGIVHWQAIGAK